MFCMRVTSSVIVSEEHIEGVWEEGTEENILTRMQQEITQWVPPWLDSWPNSIMIKISDNVIGWICSMKGLLRKP